MFLQTLNDHLNTSNPAAIIFLPNWNILLILIIILLFFEINLLWLINQLEKWKKNRILKQTNPVLSETPELLSVYFSTFQQISTCSLERFSFKWGSSIERLDHLSTFSYFNLNWMIRDCPHFEYLIAFLATRETLPFSLLQHEIYLVTLQPCIEFAGPLERAEKQCRLRFTCSELK